MWLQPCGSRADMLKSSRWRFDIVGTQAMPRLQMSPTCRGVLVIGGPAHVAPDGPFCRFRDCAAYRFHGQGPTSYATVLLPAQPTGRTLPRASVGSVACAR